MEDQRFDELTKRVASSVSRRTALKAALIAGVGGFLGLGGTEVASADAGKCLGDKCELNKQCCTGVCDPNTQTCACPGGQTNCSGNCLNLQTDSANCGACGNACPNGQACVGGVCECATTLCVTVTGSICCLAGQDCCKGQCVSLNTTQNCGACGTVCGSGQACINGTCQCAPGNNLCSVTNACIPANSCCTSADCAVSGQTCSGPGGTCACPASQKPCSASNSCIPNASCCTNTDCPSGQACVNGLCECASAFCGNNTCCGAGRTCLNNQCVCSNPFNPVACVFVGFCGSPGCQCALTADGSIACISGALTCASDAQCPPGQTCFKGNCTCIITRLNQTQGIEGVGHTIQLSSNRLQLSQSVVPNRCPKESE